MASHDVFISYPSQDKVSADGVCHGLEARGIRCWMAPRDVIPGSDWQTSLLDAISDARVVVLLFTAATNSSDHIKREVTAAFEGGAVVIPFRLENVSPQGSLRYHLTGVHWLDAFSGAMEPHVEQLATTIKRVLAQPQAEAAAPVVTPVIGPGADAKPATPPPPAPPPEPVRPALATAAAGPATSPSAGATSSAAPKTTPTAPRPAAPPPRSASTTLGKSGGIKPWMVFAGVCGAAVLIIAALALSQGGSDAATGTAATDPTAAGVDIGVASRPEPQGASTPIQPLEGVPQTAASADASETVAPANPGLDDPAVDPEYVEEPYVEPDGGDVPTDKPL